MRALGRKESRKTISSPPAATASVATRRFAVPIPQNSTSLSRAHIRITRLLAEEGLGWSGVEATASDATDAAPGFSAGAAHLWQIFASGDSFIEDPSSAADGGIRWHQAGSQKQSDALFDWRQSRTLRSNQTATLSWVAAV